MTPLRFEILVLWQWLQPTCREEKSQELSTDTGLPLQMYSSRSWGKASVEGWQCSFVESPQIPQSPRTPWLTPSAAC